MRVHERKCENAFTCSLEQHLSTAGNILYFVLLAMHSDLNSHFKKLNTSNTSLTLEEHHKPKHALATLSVSNEIKTLSLPVLRVRQSWTAANNRRAT